MRNFKKYYVLDGAVKAKFENPVDPVRIIKAREERNLKLPTVGVAARAGERSQFKTFGFVHDENGQREGMQERFREEVTYALAQCSVINSFSQNNSREPGDIPLVEIGYEYCFRVGPQESHDKSLFTDKAVGIVRLLKKLQQYMNDERERAGGFGRNRFYLIGNIRAVILADGEAVARGRAYENSDGNSDALYKKLVFDRQNLLEEYFAVSEASSNGSE